MLEEGTKAPNFMLNSTQSKKISLADFNGKKNVILAFYPADNTPVCTNQLAFYNEVLPLFEQHDAEILGINNDTIETHSNFAKQLELDYPLLSDEKQDSSVLKAYNVYDEKYGTSKRALYVIDKSGIIRWKYLSPIDINPGADGIIRALENINSS